MIFDDLSSKNTMSRKTKINLVELILHSIRLSQDSFLHCHRFFDIGTTHGVNICLLLALL